MHLDRAALGNAASHKQAAGQLRLGWITANTVVPFSSYLLLPIGELILVNNDEENERIGDPGLETPFYTA